MAVWKKRSRHTDVSTSANDAAPASPRARKRSRHRESGKRSSMESRSVTEAKRKGSGRSVQQRRTRRREHSTHSKDRKTQRQRRPVSRNASHHSNVSQSHSVDINRSLKDKSPGSHTRVIDTSGNSQSRLSDQRHTSHSRHVNRTPSTHSRHVDRSRSSQSRHTDRPHSSLSHRTDRLRSSHSRHMDRPRTSQSRLKDQPRSTHSRHTDRPRSYQSRHTDRPRSYQSRHEDRPRSSHSRHTDRPRSSQSRHTDRPRSSHSRHTDRPRSSHSRHTDRPRSSHSRHSDRPRSSHSRHEDRPRSSHSRHLDQPRSSHVKDVLRSSHSRHKNKARSSRSRFLDRDHPSHTSFKERIRSQHRDFDEIDTPFVERSISRNSLKRVRFTPVRDSKPPPGRPPAKPPSEPVEGQKTPLAPGKNYMIPTDPRLITEMVRNCGTRVPMQMFERKKETGQKIQEAINVNKYLSHYRNVVGNMFNRASGGFIGELKPFNCPQPKGFWSQPVEMVYEGTDENKPQTSHFQTKKPEAIHNEERESDKEKIPRENDTVKYETGNRQNRYEYPNRFNNNRMQLVPRRKNMDIKPSHFNFGSQTNLPPDPEVYQKRKPAWEEGTSVVVEMNDEGYSINKFQGVSGAKVLPAGKNWKNPMMSRTNLLSGFINNPKESTTSKGKESEDRQEGSKTSMKRVTAAKESHREKRNAGDRDEDKHEGKRKHKKHHEHGKESKNHPENFNSYIRQVRRQLKEYSKNLRLRQRDLSESPSESKEHRRAKSGKSKRRHRLVEHSSHKLHVHHRRHH